MEGAATKGEFNNAMLKHFENCRLCKRGEPCREFEKSYLGLHSTQNPLNSPRRASVEAIEDPISKK
jgi:hypothetical protein